MDTRPSLRMSNSMARKPSSADRTLSMFSTAAAGAAKLEDQTTADAEDAARPSETIEQAAERWRASAFYTQELVSKLFLEPPEAKAGHATFRLTEKDGWLFLEQYRNGKDGMAYHWSGVMFPYSDLYELAGVIVKAAKEKQAREKV